MSESGGRCPECKRPTLRRQGGEWCQWCRGWVETVTMHYSALAGNTIRTLRGHH